MENKSNIDIFIDWLKNNPELMKVLYEIRVCLSDAKLRKVENSIWGKERGINTPKQIRSMMNDFFSKNYSKALTAEVNSILDGTNTYFVDPETGERKVFFNNTGNNAVVIKDGNKYLEFYVGIKNCLNDYLHTAHELSHAMSAHYRTKVDNIRNSIDFLVSYDPIHDGMTEIEALITERMFVKYLLNNRLIKDRDAKAYLNSDMTSLRWELRSIIGGDGKISDQIYGNENERVGNQKDGKVRRGDYYFRYVVARIVADQWIKKYSSASEKEKEVMIENYEDYLKHTDEASIDSACQFLLGKDFVNVAQDFMKDLKNEQEKDKNPPDRTRGFWQGVKDKIGNAGVKGILSCLPVKKHSNIRDKTDEKSQ